MTPTHAAAAKPRQVMTLDEYWEFVNRPENADRFFELRRGEVVEMSRPKTPHGIVASLIATELNLYARQVRKGYVTSNDAGVVLSERPGTVVGPDVAYFSDASTFDEIAPKWAETPPVLAVEVLSPNDKMSEMNEKIEDYLRAGVRLVWLVDYERRKVTVYRPDRTLAVLNDTDELTGGDELPGFSVRVADFFRLPGDPFVPPPAA
ncbi:MAG: Uma2 family endonuclease [Gemmataceae bacterium]|nr:Uma2 family endonuclease [Gemmataceae bacterium]